MSDNARAPDSAWSLAAVGVLAMCTVTAAHEALGHGSACLALGGRITQLTSALFGCDLHSRWIAPAGPLMNLAIGSLALALRRRTARIPMLHLLSIFVNSFAWFWEGGYCVQAMIKGDGDLYFTGQDFIGTPEVPWRVVGGIFGLALYLTTIQLTFRGLLQYFGHVARVRRAARWAWLSATLSAAGAAAAYTGPGLRDLHDAVFEIGVASLPLLWLPAFSRTRAAVDSAPRFATRLAVPLAVFIYAGFVLTLGIGLGLAEGQ